MVSSFAGTMCHDTENRAFSARPSVYREENAYSTVNVAACVVTLLVALRTTQRYIWPLR